MVHSCYLLYWSHEVNGIMPAELTRHQRKSYQPREGLVLPDSAAHPITHLASLCHLSHICY